MTRHAIVTGSSRGVGLATCELLLERGWQVTGLARGEAPAELSSERYVHERLDLTDAAGVQEFFEGQFAQRLSTTNPERLALVNNAATLAPMRPLVRCDADELARSLTLNVATPTWLAGYCLRHARERAVRIVDLSSGAAHGAYPGWGAYCAGKAALRMIDQVFAVELAEYDELSGADAAVLTYAPGVVATAMQAEIRAASAQDFPRLARFQELHDSRSLVPAEAPAREIADWLESSEAGAHAERRFGA